LSFSQVFASLVEGMKLLLEAISLICISDRLVKVGDIHLDCTEVLNPPEVLFDLLFISQGFSCFFLLSTIG
jgi:hypothetical protein